MHAYSRSISTIWLANTPISAIGLFLVLFIRSYTLKRTIIRGDGKKPGDVEKVAGQPIVGGDQQVGESLENEKRSVTRDDATETTQAEPADVTNDTTKP